MRVGGGGGNLRSWLSCIGRAFLVSQAMTNGRNEMVERLLGTARLLGERVCAADGLRRSGGKKNRTL